MARVNWTKENLDLLKGYGKANDLAGAAQRFNCTENAVKIKYGRMFGSRKAASIYDRMYPKTNKKTKSKVLLHALTEAFQESNDNPFVIQQVPFTGTRTTPEIVIMLAKQMLSIKADKVDSILVPNSVANTKAAANNIFQQAKSYIAKTNKAELAFTIKSTFSGDTDKKYLSGRIWRLK
jgi:hypothetical protein